jgi:hypothetical protein
MKEKEGEEMKKLFLLAMIGLLVSGCVGATGWVKGDGQPFDQAQFEKDREECNRGWGICLTVDILITGGFVSLIHYFEARHCITTKGYVRENSKEEAIQNASKGKTEGEKIIPNKESRDEIWVMVWPEGRFYHLPPCPVVKSYNGLNMKLKDAEKRGYMPCPHCIK